MPFPHSHIQLESAELLLKPLALSDAGPLSRISGDSAIWAFFTSDLYTSEAMQGWIQTALDQLAGELRYPFSIRELRTGKLCGSTSFGNYSERDQRIEIGWTWLGREFHGTGLNRECKKLLLQYAFEEMGLQRVEFKTDVLNLQSRNALQKIGATEEGILRSHVVMPDGRRRDSIYYSILANEWPRLKQDIFTPK